MQRLKLRIEESGEKLSAAYAPPKWSETAGKGRSRKGQLLATFFCEAHWSQDICMLFINRKICSFFSFIAYDKQQLQSYISRTSDNP